MFVIILWFIHQVIYLTTWYTKRLTIGRHIINSCRIEGLVKTFICCISAFVLIKFCINFSWCLFRVVCICGNNVLNNLIAWLLIDWKWFWWSFRCPKWNIDRSWWFWCIFFAAYLTIKILIVTVFGLGPQLLHTIQVI